MRREAQRGFAEVENGRLYYEVIGDGDPVALIHGFGLDARMWDGQAETLADRYRVIRYDARGFGRSSIPTAEPFSHAGDLRALLRLLGATPVHVVGLSMGGAIALNFALLHPAEVCSLVLVDAALNGFEWSEAWSASFDAIEECARRDGVDRAKRIWLEHELFASARERPECAAALARMVGDWSGWQLLNEAPTVPLLPPAAARLSEIQAPSLVVVGERDLPDFLAIADLLAEGIPSARKVVLRRVGHMCNMEAAPEFNEVLTAFLAAQPSLAYGVAMKFPSLWFLCIALALAGCNAAGFSPPAARDTATSSAPGGSNELVLHSFGGPDGAAASTGMLRDKSGAFYGTTLFGGAGVGAVFKLTPSGSGYVEKVLYSFKGGLDGSAPWGMIERHGIFYGVTFLGGDPSGNGGAGWGTIFKLAHTKSGYVETVLYRFTGPSNAWEPNGPIVMDAAGVIYGSSGFGGTHNFGTIFKVAPTGSGYVESVLYSFPGGAGGQEPQAGLTIDKHGAIYGTTMYGGSNRGRPCRYPGCGTVFKVTQHGSSYSESVIYAFHGNRDGDLPYGALTVDDRTGVVYGTTYWGGTKGNGAVFALTPHGSRYSDKILHSFTGKSDGFLPEGKLLLASDGALYGTAALGGGGCHGIGCGAVFSLVPSGSGYAFHVLFDFQDPIRGAEPEQTNLIADESGALYGTTRSGGTQTSCSDGGPGGAAGCGVVFKITP